MSLAKNIGAPFTLSLLLATSGCETSSHEVLSSEDGDGSVAGDGGSANNEPGTGGTSPTGSGGSSNTDMGPLPEPTLDLSERLDAIDVPLSATVTNGSFARGFLLPGARPTGGLTLGWNHNEEGRLTRLDADMKQVGQDWLLDGQLILDVAGLPDDGVVVMVTDYGTGLGLTNAFQLDLQLRLLRLDADGNVLAEVPIVGGNGRAEGEDWYAWSPVRSVDVIPNGERFSVFTKISHNFDTPEDIHQGDLYIEVDANGALDEDTRDWWGSSHSNRLHALLGPAGETLTLTVGDGGPYGLVYHNQNDSTRQVIWPPEDQRELGDAEGISTIDAGDLCGFSRQGDTLFATVSTVPEQPFNYRDDNGDIAVLSWPMAGGDVSVSWLTDTPDVPERCPTLTPFKDHQLSVWGARDRLSATMALLDSEGNLVSGPTESTAPFDQYSMTVPLADGSVAWTYVDFDDDAAQVVVVRP